MADKKLIDIELLSYYNDKLNAKFESIESNPAFDVPEVGDEPLYLTNTGWVPMAAAENGIGNADGSTAGLVVSGGDVTIDNGIITVNNDSHAHTLETIYNEDGDTLEEILEGYAPLNGGKIPASMLPSYVDDVVEIYFEDDVAYDSSGSELVPESGKIYIDSDNGKIYRYSGSILVEVVSGGVVIGTVEGTAFDGAAGAQLQNDVEDLEQQVADLVANGTDGIKSVSVNGVALDVDDNGGVNIELKLATETDIDNLFA